MKKNKTHLFLLKHITYLLIVIQLGMGSISLAELFFENEQNLIEYSNSFENKSMMDENEKEVDDIFKLVLEEEKNSLQNYTELRSHSDAITNNEHSEICTPPPEHS